MSTMPPVRLRAYEAKDLDALQALDAVCFTPIFRFSRATMRRFAEARNALVRVGVASTHTGEEVVAGFCIVHLERAPDAGRQGYVVTLDVEPRYRGQGLGHLLVGTLESVARDRGADRMALHVSVANGAAIRLYEGLGYTRVRVEPGFYAEGGDAFLYRKPLGDSKTAL